MRVCIRGAVTTVLMPEGAAALPLRTLGLCACDLAKLATEADERGGSAEGARADMGGGGRDEEGEDKAKERQQWDGRAGGWLSK